MKGDSPTTAVTDLGDENRLRRYTCLYTSSFSSRDNSDLVISFSLRTKFLALVQHTL